jgi:hypothetical protein
MDKPKTKTNVLSSKLNNMFSCQALFKKKKETFHVV